MEDKAHELAVLKAQARIKLEELKAQEQVTTEVLQFLVDSGNISQASMDKVLA